MTRKDTFSTVQYKGYWIHTCYEYLSDRTAVERVKVQDPETYLVKQVPTFRAAKHFITRRVNAKHQRDTQAT